jgi:Protein of unknown function (DUF3618)
MTDRSAEELERDAERIRAGIADTTDEIKGRMSPGQMVDEVARYFRDSDGSIALDRLRHQVRENPMALGLIGTGIAWLMMGGRTGRHHEAAYDYDEDYGDVPRMPGSAYGSTTPGASYTPAPGSSYGASESPTGSGTRYGSAAGAGSVGSTTESSSSSYASSVGSAARQAGSSAKEAVGGFAEKTGSFARGTSDRLRSMSHDARDRAGSMGQGAFERGRHAAGASREYASRGTQSLVDALEREPLITGAIGLAVGAAIGAMLPNTRYENRAFGDARDRMMEGAGDAFEQARERAGHVAQDTYAAARDAAEREGLMPGEGDRPLAEKLGNVAKAAAGTAQTDAEREAEDERRRMAGTSGTASMPGTPYASAGASATAPRSTTPGSATGSSAAGSSGSVGGTDRPKTGTDDLTSRGTVPKRDVGPGGTGPG